MPFWNGDIAFRLGYQAGRKRGHLSPRQASQLYPGMPVDMLAVFLNGADDGARRDRWRLNGAQRRG